MSDTLLLRCDGGSRGNPGVAGFGAAFFNPDTTTIHSLYAGYIGEYTNNVAEYYGLLAGLAQACDQGVKRLTVELDSKLIVMQMQGVWKVKDENLKTLNGAAREYIARIPQGVEFRWIPRERNSIADKLANLAMDKPTIYPVSAVGQSHKVAPEVIGIMGAPAEKKPAFRAPRHGWGQAPQSRSTRVILVRHGQTPLSIERRFAGSTDQELTAVGQEQARLAAQFVVRSTDFSALYSSPLTRCKQTAQAISDLSGTTITLEQSLRETDFGAWEGLLGADIKRDFPQLYNQWMQDPAIAPPGGESLVSTYTRTRNFLNQLAGRHSGEVVVVVSHVGPIKAALGFALGLGPLGAMKMYLELASTSVIEVRSDGSGYVRAMNETGYLFPE